MKQSRWVEGIQEQPKRDLVKTQKKKPYWVVYVLFAVSLITFLVVGIRAAHTVLSKEEPPVQKESVDKAPVEKKAGNGIEETETTLPNDEWIDNVELALQRLNAEREQKEAEQAELEALARLESEQSAQISEAPRSPRRNTSPPPPPPSEPTVTISGPTEVRRGHTAHFDATATDLNGDSLSYSWSGAAGSGASAGRCFPSPGQYSVSVTVSDSSGGSASANVTVNVI